MRIRILLITLMRIRIHNTAYVHVKENQKYLVKQTLQQKHSEKESDFELFIRSSTK
jgi:hypothetical protein